MTSSVCTITDWASSSLILICSAAGLSDIVSSSEHGLSSQLDDFKWNDPCIFIWEIEALCKVIRVHLDGYSSCSRGVSDLLQTVDNLCLLDEVQNFIIIYCACSLTQRLESSLFDQVCYISDFFLLIMD
ncbi:hypothetical protein AKJ16_DCAP18219 [Drosera capensis]